MDNREDTKNLKEQELEYLSEVAKKPGGRVFAVIALVFLAALFITTIVLGIMNSKYFMGMLALCILCPIGLYIFLWIGKLLRNR